MWTAEHQAKATTIPVAVVSEPEKVVRAEPKPVPPPPPAEKKPAPPPRVVEKPKPPPPPAPVAAPPAPVLEKHGTQVNFVCDPVEAADIAARQKKLLFVLHLSGNFEDNQFT